MPHCFNTCNIGEAQLVVQDAFEIIISSAFNISSFTPKTIVLILSSVAGADRITFLAPAVICLFAS